MSESVGNTKRGLRTTSFDQLFASVERQYMPPIQQEIRERILQSTASEPDFRDVVRGFESYFNPRIVYMEPDTRARRAVSFLHDNLFLIVAALMALAFAGLGFYVDKNSGYLDIAKIFAGAIVGNAASSSARALRQTRNRRSAES